MRSSADNQQETFTSYFYYTGFCAGELSCSLLKLKNRKSKTGGIYFTPDITISNAEISLLKEISFVIGKNCGVISRIKGGFNLSFRGKEKVKKVLSFFHKFPVICGDLTQSKIFILEKCLSVLEKQREYKRSLTTQKNLERFRAMFKTLKKNSCPSQIFPQKEFRKEFIGYFLSGVFDAEGSVGMKKHGRYFESFAAVAMKDEKIVKLFHKFLQIGHVRLRKDGMWHFECNRRFDVLKILDFFSEKYPGKLVKMRQRIKSLKRILNDYTRVLTKIGE